MDWSWLAEAAKNGVLWAVVVAFLLVAFFAALRKGTIRTNREYQDMRTLLEARLADAKEIVAEQRALMRDQTEIDRKRQDVLEDLMEGQRTMVALIQALPRPRPTAGGRRT